MSANNAEPTGEVKNPDEPLLGNNGVDYDSYASDGNIKKATNVDMDFDSKEFEKRQKTEYFVNIEGAEKIKREQERREREETRRRIQNLRKEQSAQKQSRGGMQQSDDTARINRKIHRRTFIQKYAAKIAAAVALVLLVVLVVVFGGGAILRNIEESGKEEKVAKETSSKTADVYWIRNKYAAESKEYYDSMQELIDNAEHDEAKAYFLVLRAEDLSKSDEKEFLEKAREDAYLSEQLKPTLESAYWISEIEKKLGNDEKANEYAEKQSERAEELSRNSNGQG